MVLEAQPVRNKDVNLTLNAVFGECIINKPYLVSGRLPKTPREFALFDDFAKKHNLSIGDTYEFKIKDMDYKISMVICGFIRSPEYIYNINGIDLMPDSYKIGFAYMKAESLENIMGENSCNQICVKLDKNADAKVFKKNLDETLGKKASSVLSFEDNKKASILADGIKEMKTVTTSLPALFFLISALIMFTTMSRIIENARMQIGTLKALGYSEFSIFIYYLCYAQIVIILGVLIGTLPSVYLTKMMIEIYKETMSLPEFTTLFSTSSITDSLIITNIFCTGTSIYICLKGMREMPADCMRPKKPKTGNVNLVERIKLIWRKMTFTEKTIVRNIFRNKMRLLMCVAGVAGCMAVIITAFGMKDSNDRFFSMLYEKLHRYDLQVTLKSDITDAQYKRIQSLKGMGKCEYQMDLPAAFISNNKKEGANVTVVEDQISLMLLDINADGTMKMPNEGAIVSSVLSKKLGLKEGDKLRADITGTNETIVIEVKQILKNINGIYIGRSVWRTLGQEYKPTTVYISSDNPKLTKGEIDKYDFVLSAKLKSEIVDSIEVQLGTMKVMVFTLTLFGGVLAFVVLYNLGIMNYYERIRELATLMVLGFYDREIKVLVLRENMIFTVLGILLGIPLGVWFHSYFMKSSESAGFEVDVYIGFLTFFIAAGLTLIFSLTVNLFLGKKFRQIDMIGALKSVE